MVSLFLRIAISFNFTYTAISLVGKGTCSFGGRWPIRIQTNLGNAGAISCNLASALVLLIVVSYWVYFWYRNREEPLIESYRSIQRNKENITEHSNEKIQEDLIETQELKIKDDQEIKDRYFKTENSPEVKMKLESSEKIINLQKKIKRLQEEKYNKEIHLNEIINSRAEEKERVKLLKKIEDTENRLNKYKENNE
jgi:hypothetical protein